MSDRFNSDEIEKDCNYMMGISSKNSFGRLYKEVFGKFNDNEKNHNRPVVHCRINEKNNITVFRRRNGN